MFRVFRENANLSKIVRILKKKSSKFFRKCFSYLSGLVMVTNEGLISLGGGGGGGGAIRSNLAYFIYPYNIINA